MLRVSPTNIRYIQVIQVQLHDTLVLRSRNLAYSSRSPFKAPSSAMTGQDRALIWFCRESDAFIRNDLVLMECN